MRLLSRALFLAALAALHSTTSCASIEQGATLFPDGSGKLTLQVRAKTQMLNMAAAQGKDPMVTTKSPEELEKTMEGFVAFTRPESKEEGEFTVVTIHAYFEDVNKVKVWRTSAQGREVNLAFKYTPAAAGGELVIEDGLTRKMAKDFGGPKEGGQAPPKGMLEMFKTMLKDFSMSASFTVPGDIASVGAGLEHKGRTATRKLDGPTLCDAIDGKEEAVKKLQERGAEAGTKLTWGASTVSDAEIAAFKKELEAAKAAWPAIREEMKKTAAEKKE